MFKKILTSLVALMFLSLPAKATTVAFDGHILAADTQMTCGHIKYEIPSKVFFSEKRKQFIAFAGSWDTYVKILYFFNHTKEMVFPISAKKDDDSGFEVLIIDKGTGTIYFYANTMTSFVVVKGPVAIGSGGDIALGAMLGGCSAVDAVAAAHMKDIFTGNHILYVEVTTEEKKEEHPTEAK